MWRSCRSLPSRQLMLVLKLEIARALVHDVCSFSNSRQLDWDLGYVKHSRCSGVNQPHYSGEAIHQPTSFSLLHFNCIHLLSTYRPSWSSSTLHQIIELLITVAPCLHTPIYHRQLSCYFGIKLLQVACCNSYSIRRYPTHLLFVCSLLPLEATATEPAL